MQCVACPQPITATPNNAAKKRYCSDKCRERDRAKRRQRPPRTCPVCLRSYRSTGLVQATCSWECAIKARHIGESCAIAVHRCTCSQWYVKHDRRWHCQTQRSDAGRLAQPHRTTPCLTCGYPITTRPNGKRYCSRRCWNASPNRRASKRRDKDNRAMRKRRAFVEVVRREVVYERDGWVCQLCHRAVPRDKAAPHPKAATIDHIIPLAAGGAHAYANVQLAHFLCNSRKSDGAAQLRWDIAA